MLPVMHVLPAASGWRMENKDPHCSLHPSVRTFMYAFISFIYLPLRFDVSVTTARLGMVGEAVTGRQGLSTQPLQHAPGIRTCCILPAEATATSFVSCTTAANGTHDDSMQDPAGMHAFICISMQYTTCFIAFVLSCVHSVLVSLAHRNIHSGAKQACIQMAH